MASLSQGRTAAAQCGLFIHKSVPVIFEPPCVCVCIYIYIYIFLCRFTSKFLNILSFVSLFILGVRRLIIPANLLCIMWEISWYIIRIVRRESHSQLSRYISGVSDDFSQLFAGVLGKLSGFVFWRLIMNYLFSLSPNIYNCDI